jgi:hypothetical protein
MEPMTGQVLEDPRSEKVIATIESCEGAGFYLPNFYESRGYRFVRDLDGYIFQIGYIEKNIGCPVSICVEYWKINDRYVVMWYGSSRYADYNMYGEWLRKAFGNARVHTGLMNIHQTLNLVKEEKTEQPAHGEA